MLRQTEQLERDAEAARAGLAYDLSELRSRLTPAQIAEEAVNYASETPLADFVGNLARDIRAHPLPLVVIFAGIAWAVLGSALRRRDPVVEPSQSPAAGTGQQTWEVAPFHEAVE